MADVGAIYGLLIDTICERLSSELCDKLADTICERLSRQMRVDKTPAKADRELTIDEVAAELQMSKDYIYRLTSGRKIPYYQNGRRVYFKESELNEWKANRANRVKTKTEIEEEAATYCAIGRSNARSIKRA